MVNSGLCSSPVETCAKFVFLEAGIGVVAWVVKTNGSIDLFTRQHRVCPDGNQRIWRVCRAADEAVDLILDCGSNSSRSDRPPEKSNWFLDAGSTAGDTRADMIVHPANREVEAKPPTPELTSLPGQIRI